MNQNRSMAVHALLHESGGEGLSVGSFGTSETIRLPGEHGSQNIYGYDTTYAAIHKDLVLKNGPFYAERGLISMLERNAAIKPCPEYLFSARLAEIDLFVSCDPRCFERIRTAFGWGAGEDGGGIRRDKALVGFDVLDSIKEAKTQAAGIADFVRCVSDCVARGLHLYDAVEQAMRVYTQTRGHPVLFAPVALCL